MAKEVASTTGAVYSVLACGTKITGNITSDYDFRIDGNVEGDVVCKGKLIIGPQAHIKGSIICINAEVYGKVDGSLEVSELLTLREESVINGPIKTSTIIIEAHASFNGTCQMSPAKTE